MTADNSMHPVTKEGDLNDRSVLLKDVYYVPGLEKKPCFCITNNRFRNVCSFLS